MRSLRLACFLGFAAFIACQPPAPNTIAIVDGSQLRILITNEKVASAILTQAGVLFSPADELLFNGSVVAQDAPLAATRSGTLQIRRAVGVTINGRSIQTAARTVGEALIDSGASLYARDRFAPLPETMINGALHVQHLSSQELSIRADGKESHVRSAAGSVGGALAEAGLPLLGLDFSKPGESDPLPVDRGISIVRVSEAVILTQKSIPFEREFTESTEVEVGVEQITQPGVNGLAVSRVRIRYEDGQEVSRQTESESVVRAPQTRIAARGTKIVLKTTTVGGVTIQYWRMLQMYATVYSPCNSGGPTQCSSGTASGLRAGKGVVAVDPGLYAYLNGQRVFIPGYGSAVIGDVGGGYIIEQNTGVSRYRWIDLGFDDNNLVDMTGWVTVYFLAPAPASIPGVLQ